MKRTIDLSGSHGHYGYKKEHLRFSEIELKHLLIAWVAISFAFAIVMGGFSLSVNFIMALVLAAITVGTGFVFHELAHKFTAQHYGYIAEFRANFQMLGLAILMSFFGFLFAAPGAVVIAGHYGHAGHINSREYGIISLAGPLTNIVLAVIFFGLSMFLPVTLPPFINMILIYGGMINSWLALFNMIPFGNFDGIKVFRWNKVVYGITAGFALLLVFGMNLI